jgi:predicted AAA+ superfamily ATPase
MYINRDVKKQFSVLKNGFPVVVVTGPRQSGKTTFLQKTFPRYKYFNLEDPVSLQLIMADPVRFLLDNPKNIIIDEVQRYPELLSFIQVHVDKNQQMGSIFLSGSQNLLISEKISQSLAGRAGYQKMFPFTIGELKKAKIFNDDLYKQLIKGGYPALYSRDVASTVYFKQYIATYTERDVRQIRNVSELSQFQKFMILLAGRVGQVVNASSLASDVGIAPNTAEDWISILEASYIVYRLEPYYKNIGKRVTKSPKLYFTDTGLLCTLLRIDSVDMLKNHYLLGNIFENFVVLEILKQFENRGISDNLYYFRDNHGNEVDLLIDNGLKQIPIEIKLSASFGHDFFKGLNYWNKLNGTKGGLVVYGGIENLKIKDKSLIAWNLVDVGNINKIINK